MSKDLTSSMMDFPLKVFTKIYLPPKVKGEIMESGFLRNIVVRQGTTILKLLTSKDDQPLLVDLNCLESWAYIAYHVRRLNLKSDNLASEGLDKDLHASPELEHKDSLDVIGSKESTHP